MIRKQRGSWIDTWSGRKFWPLDPHPQDVAIEDIAGALSNLCRFGGHTREFYSVAQHSVLVAEVLSAEPADTRMWALLHDAAEAYLVDVPRPLKTTAAFASYREAEQRILAAIAKAFGLPTAMPKQIDSADRLLLATESRDLMSPSMLASCPSDVEPLPARIEPWSPGKARDAFMDCFYRVSMERGVRGLLTLSLYPSCPIHN